MKISALTLALFGFTSGVQAHVAGLPPAEHAVEHAWLALVLVPVLALILPLVRGGR